MYAIKHYSKHTYTKRPKPNHHHSKHVRTRSKYKMHTNYFCIVLGPILRLQPKITMIPCETSQHGCSFPFKRFICWAIHKRTSKKPNNPKIHTCSTELRLQSLSIYHIYVTICVSYVVGKHYVTCVCCREDQKSCSIVFSGRIFGVDWGRTRLVGQNLLIHVY